MALQGQTEFVDTARRDQEPLPAALAGAKKTMPTALSMLAKRIRGVGSALRRFRTGSGQRGVGNGTPYADSIFEWALRFSAGLPDRAHPRRRLETLGELPYDRPAPVQQGLSSLPRSYL